MDVIRERAHRLWKFLYRHRLTIWIVTFTLVTGWALQQAHVALVGLHESDEREAHEEIVEEAQRCVTSWETRENIRDAVERGTRGGARVAAEALILTIPDADPADVATFRAFINSQAETEVQAARAEIPYPECDLEAAQAILEQE